MVIAVVVLHETLSPAMIAAFICIWLSVAIFIGDAAWQVRSRRAAKSPSAREEGLPTPPSLEEKGAGGLGFRVTR
jgi:hypothetical protein